MRPIADGLPPDLPVEHLTVSQAVWPKRSSASGSASKNDPADKASVTVLDRHTAGSNVLRQNTARTSARAGKKGGVMRERKSKMYLRDRFA